MVTVKSVRMPFHERFAFGEDMLGPVVEVDAKAANLAAEREEEPTGIEKPEPDQDGLKQSHAASFAIFISALASVFIAAISQSPSGILDCT